MHHGVTRSLGGKHCTGVKVKCNPHGVDIPFLMFFFCNVFAARTDQAIYSISTFFLPDDVDRRSLHSQGGSHKISQLLPLKSLKNPCSGTFQCKTYYRQSALLVPSSNLMPGLGHRIANFPNYVTITSSLTHHRIVNLGPQRFGPLRPARTKARGYTPARSQSPEGRPTADVMLTSPFSLLIVYAGHSVP